VRQNLPIHRPFALAGAGVSPEAEAILHGRFTFVGLPEVTATLPDWRQAPEGSLLWLFNLHYFEWAVPLAQAYVATSQTAFAERLVALMLDWVKKNPPGRGPGWHPYPTSRRIVSWCQALAALQDTMAVRSASQILLPSLALQVARLTNTLEEDIRGNHLLANLHGLTWAEALLAPMLPADLAARLRPFAARYWKEFMAQTRPDGSHEENSPSYAIGVLKDAFETLVMAERSGWGVPVGVTERVTAMFEHQVSLLTPAGEPPLVNDTVLGYPMPVRELLAAGATYFSRGDWKWVAEAVEPTYTIWLFGEPGASHLAQVVAEPPAETAFAQADSGYYVLRSGWGPEADYILFDAGPLGPRHQLGHAHADTLSVIVYSAGRPILLDPGVYDYRPGPWRDHFRGTPAHNTVTVDGEDSSEVWHAFRTARHAHAEVVAWVPGECVAAVHDGYRRLRHPVSHARTVDALGAGAWVIRDRLTASGRHPHRYGWTWQLAPDVEDVSLSGLTARVAFAGGVEAAFVFDGPAGLVLAVEPGWVAVGWHERLQAPVLKLRLEAADAEVEVSMAMRVTTGAVSART
jgi:uncharacterized heparinase superfamily protein